MPKLPNEDWKVIAVRSPATMANVQVLSDVVDMSKYRTVIAILLLGDMAAETIDFSLQTDSASAFNVDVQTLVAATQLAASAANNDNKQVVLQAVVEKMKPGHRYLRARGITGAGTGGPAAIILLGEPRYSSEANLASVLEVKAA
jgi:hypothetical protein